MKNTCLVHLAVDSCKTTIDGWKRKKCHKGELDKSYGLVSSTHDDLPKPSDLIKTAAAHDSIIVGYNTAWRKLKEEGMIQTIACSKTFELIIPSLEKWMSENPSTVVYWGADAENHL